MRARSEWLKSLALSAATVAVLALAGECALRLAGFAPERYARTTRLISPNWAVTLDCFPTNPRGYFDVDLRDPATRARYRAVGVTRLDEAASRAPFAVELRFNSLGFRDAEVPPRRPGVRRVMVLGDSFTEGEGVKARDVYPRVLERLLNAAEPGRWEVFDCAHRGADFPDLFASFELLLGYDPDVVVYGMVLNDPVQSPEFHARQAYLNDWILARGQMVGRRPPPRLGFFEPRLAAWLSERLQSARVARDTTRWYRDMYAEPNRDGWRQTEAYLVRMDRELRARGGSFLVALWPLLVGLDGRYPFDEVHGTIGRFCRDAGIPELDLLPALRGRAPAALWVHPVDMHPNEIAHALVAEALAPALRGLAAAAPATRRGSLAGS